jgi:hypothetical protein
LENGQGFWEEQWRGWAVVLGEEELHEIEEMC